MTMLVEAIERAGRVERVDSGRIRNSVYKTFSRHI